MRILVAVAATVLAIACSSSASSLRDARAFPSLQLRYVEAVEPTSTQCLNMRSENPRPDKRVLVTDDSHCVLAGPARATLRHIIDADYDRTALAAGRIEIVAHTLGQDDYDAARRVVQTAHGRLIAVVFQGRLYGPVQPAQLLRDQDVVLKTDLRRPITDYIVKLLRGSRI